MIGFRSVCPVLVGLGIGLAPIAFVGAGAVTDDASGAFTLFAPASPQNGDIWILLISSDDADGFLDSSNLSNWTFIVGSNVGTAPITVAWFRWAGSNPDLTATWGGVGQICAGIAAFRGCIASGSPIDTLGAVNDGSGTSLISIPGITPVLPNCMLVACDVAINDLDRTTPPSGFTAAFNPGSGNSYKATAGADASVAIHYKNHTSGATGSLTDNMSGAVAYSSVLLALKPA
jgi:hypothetical protein